MNKKCDYSGCKNFKTDSSKCDECLKAFKNEHICDYFEGTWIEPNAPI